MTRLVSEPIIDHAMWAIRAFRLERAWDFVETFHTPNLGYHNLDHIVLVMGAAVKISIEMDYIPRLPVIAAMFHDMGHSGGRLTDDQNVEHAIRQLRLACECNLLDLNTEDYDIVGNAILSTQFVNSIFPRGPESKVGAIMRDADLWNPHLCKENARTMITGLAEEMNPKKQQQNTASQTPILMDEWRNICQELNQAISRTQAFFKTVQWFTKPAQDLSHLVQPNLEALKYNFEEL